MVNIKTRKNPRITPWKFGINKLDLRRTKDVINISLVKTAFTYSYKIDEHTMFIDEQSLLSDRLTARTSFSQVKQSTLIGDTCHFTEMITNLLAYAVLPTSFTALNQIQPWVQPATE